jgi:hypothetical protein
LFRRGAPPKPLSVSEVCQIHPGRGYGHASSFFFDSVSENSRKGINFIIKRARGGLRIPTVIYMSTFLASLSIVSAFLKHVIWLEEQY